MLSGPHAGVPTNPRAWLVSTGRFKAIDRLRRAKRFDALDEISEPINSEQIDTAMITNESIEDDRLRLIFTCCHPARKSGPFAETKELIAGYTIIKANSREEAIEWTKRFPNPAGDGNPAQIEVRQFFELEDFEPSETIDRLREMESELHR